MNLYDWYKIYNLDTFLGSNIVSREITLFLDGQGEKTMLLTRGNVISLLYEGILLSINLGGNNPFEFESHAIFIDGNNDIWLGILST